MYKLSGGLTQTNTNGKFTNLAAGEYSVEIEDSEGCLTIRSFVLGNPSRIELEIVGDTIIRCQDTVILQAITSLNEIDIESIQWYAGQRLVEEAKNLDGEFPGNRAPYYLVRIRNSDGCETESRIDVKFDNSLPYFAPNVFSPNHDNINDVFKLYFDEQVRIVHTFRVFDRFGALMCGQEEMNPNDAAFGWNGVHRGQAMIPGVYAWLAEIDGCDGKRVLLKGDVTILK